MKRNRKAKILATLGPASSDKKIIEDLFVSGCDVFRLNFSFVEFFFLFRSNFSLKFCFPL